MTRIWKFHFTPIDKFSAWRGKLFLLFACAIHITLFCGTGYGQDEKESPSNIFEKLSESELSLQRAVSGPGKGEAATFSFLSTVDEKTVFNANFALIYSPKSLLWDNIADYFTLTLHSSIEGNLTSDESESENAWRFRISSAWDHTSPEQNEKFTEFIDSHVTYASIKYESDQDFEVEKLSLEFLWTPTIRSLAMGIKIPKTGPFRFRWRPYLGFDFGHTSKAGDSLERDDTILRLLARGRMRLDLDFLSELLGLNKAATFIYLDNKFYHLPLEDGDDTHNFFVSGIQFELTKNFTFGVLYKLGEDAPNFNHIETVGGTFGVKF